MSVLSGTSGYRTREPRLAFGEIWVEALQTKRSEGTNPQLSPWLAESNPEPRVVIGTCQ
jgi:hypothetical protein